MSFELRAFLKLDQYGWFKKINLVYNFEEKVVYIKYPCDDEYLLAIKLLTLFLFNVPSNVHVESLCLKIRTYSYIFFLLV